MARYNIKEFNEYSKKPYTTYQPLEVGNFSLDNQGDFINCDTATFPGMKSFQLPLNLDEGFDAKEIDRKESGFPPGEKPLRWIRGNSEGYRSVADVDVVTQKGVLKQIGHTVINTYKNPWKIEACKYKGKMYMRFPEGESYEMDGRRISSFPYGLGLWVCSLIPMS